MANPSITGWPRTPDTPGIPENPVLEESHEIIPEIPLFLTLPLKNLKKTREIISQEALVV